MSGNYEKVAYYPGCALEGTGHAYNRSTKELGKALGLELTELKNWNCCGAMEVKNIDPKLQTYLSARNLSIADEMGFKTVMAPCNGCYHNLKKAEYDLTHDGTSREVNDRLSKKAGHKTYEAGKVETIHALDWIKRTIGEEGLKARVRNSLRGLKVAACTRGHATSSRRRIGGQGRNRPPSRISWTICWLRPAPRTSIIRSRRRAAAAPIRFPTATPRPSSCSTF